MSRKRPCVIGSMLCLVTMVTFLRSRRIASSNVNLAIRSHSAFVNSATGSLGTMAFQNAVSVAISGGTISNTIITSANIANSTSDRVTLTGGWALVPVGVKLYFQFNGNNIASLDSSGNFTTIGNVTAFGSA